MTLELRKDYFEKLSKQIKNKTEDYKECQSILDNIYSKECNIENRGQEKEKFLKYSTENNTLRKPEILTTIVIGCFEILFKSE